MTNVAFVGLGKLGYPVAAAMAANGMTVYGVDSWPSGRPDISREDKIAETLKAAGDNLKGSILETAIAKADVVFCAVQTPHHPRFEGITPLTDERADFNYSYLVQACQRIAEEAQKQDRHITLAVISTVLPGTMRRHVQPVLNEHVTLVYTPSFIAMGTVIRDFLDPEFVLIGGDTNHVVERVYQQACGADVPVVRTTVENAELIKVAYNTMIGLKIAYANTLMEVCHKTGCDIDEVTGALKQAHRRLISPAYLDGGMGDGGGCHPRDNIALSWLARELDLSYDLFGAAMHAREAQAKWLCELLVKHAGDLPLAILGVEFKPGSNSTTGSAAVLCARLLRREGHPVACLRRTGQLPETPMAFLVGCKHPEFVDTTFPAGSVVIDPHRYIPDQEGVEVVRVGASLGAASNNGATRTSEELRLRAA